MMNLLPEDKLVWSPVVVNSRMNRERKASGVNSYEREFHFKPQDYLHSRIKENGKAAWLDLCCGQGNALIQTAHYFHDQGLQQQVHLEGIDLVDSFPVMDPGIKAPLFTVQSLAGWEASNTYDLITCVHGLHYLGDKLKIIEQCAAALAEKGLFIANLDLANISIRGTGPVPFLGKLFKQAGFSYHTRSRILKRLGHQNTGFNLTYLGADDSFGPNYTGQNSVTSYYTV